MSIFFGIGYFLRAVAQAINELAEEDPLND